MFVSGSVPHARLFGYQSKFTYTINGAGGALDNRLVFLFSPSSVCLSVTQCPSFAAVCVFLRVCTCVFACVHTRMSILLSSKAAPIEESLLLQRNVFKTVSGYF